MASRAVHRAAVGALAASFLLGAVAPPAWSTARPAASPAGPTAATRTAQPAVQPAGHRVTLITGDRVTVRSHAPKRLSLSIDRVPGRTKVSYVYWYENGDLYVLPRDAYELVARGWLDRRLFNVSGLIRQGYDDQHARELPLIVAYERSPRARTAHPRLAAARRIRSLPVLNAEAVTADRAAGFWDSLTSGDIRQRTARPGIRAVWLDGMARPLLEQSVPQVGAPQAWRAGYDGKGVTVAVLDTGYDPDHPDLEGVVTEARDFTGSASGVDDEVGHGTHVASIIAGRGTASRGKYTGVAKGANLIVGKVCLPAGCPESAIIAGMEWAAPKAQGREVRTFSLTARGVPAVAWIARRRKRSSGRTACRPRRTVTTRSSAVRSVCHYPQDRGS